MRKSLRLSLALIAAAAVTLSLGIFRRPTAPQAAGTAGSTTAVTPAPRPLDGAGLGAPRAESRTSPSGAPREHRRASRRTGSRSTGRVVESRVGNVHRRRDRFAFERAQDPNGSGRQAPTDAEGRFHVEGLPDDAEVTLEAHAPGHVAARVQVKITKGTPSPASARARTRRRRERHGSRAALGRHARSRRARPRRSGDRCPGAGAGPVRGGGGRRRTRICCGVSRGRPSWSRPWIRSTSSRPIAAADGTFRLDGLRLDFAYEIGAVGGGRDEHVVGARDSPGRSAPRSRRWSSRFAVLRPSWLGSRLPRASRSRRTRRFACFAAGSSKGRPTPTPRHVCRFDAVDPGTVKLLVRALGFEPVIVTGRRRRRRDVGGSDPARARRRRRRCRRGRGGRSRSRA